MDLAELDPAECLASTDLLDIGHPEVHAFAARAIERHGSPSTDRERAVAIFHAVRDSIRYDPYLPISADALRASAVARSDRNWCVPKSNLLTAACRAIGIPAALGYSDVRNHLQSEKLRATMGTDLFAWHGYSVILVEGEWRKVSSAFNVDLCERFGTKVLAWDGTHDALMHPFDESGNRHMEYVVDRGIHVDVPLDAMMATFLELYPSHTADDVRSRGADDEHFA
jgi:transglutaminase-like putative cysteine protease